MPWIAGDRIGQRVFRLILLWSLALTALITVAQFLMLHREASASALEDIERTRILQSSALAASLWQYDIVQLKVLLEGVRGLPYVSFVAIDDRRSLRLEAGTRRPGDRTIASPLLYDSEGASIDIGSLEIHVDEARILADVSGGILRSLLFQALFLLVESVFIIVIFGRLVTRHLRAMAGHLRDFDIRGGNRPLVLAKKDRSDELDILAASLNGMDRALAASRAGLERSLAEKEALLQEVFHRTRNNMQVIASLIDMQAMYAEDEGSVAAAREMVGRIKAMSIVHQKLYESRDLSRIDMGDYCAELLRQARASFLSGREGIRLEAEVQEGFSLLIDTAIPCGLVLNELIVNAISHGLKERSEGSVRIGLRRLEDGTILLSVRDDGAGLPPGFELRSAGGMGLNTVAALAEYQLQGKLDVSTAGGTTFTLAFKDDLYRPRI